MKRWMATAAVAAAMIGGAAAQQPKADCSKFRKLGDGRWTSTIDAKIGNPKSFIRLQPGLPIERDTMIVGLNVTDTLNQLCGGK